MILFAPGAGAPSGSPWMNRWAGHLETLGSVVRFDYPYQREGRKSPDRRPKLVQAHRAALNQAVAEASSHGNEPAIVLAGKSMGSRVGCHVALEEPRVSALVCLGYPLRSSSGAIRDEVLVALEKPILFVQGSRDPLCPIDQLEAVRLRMRAKSGLHIVQGGAHSLGVGKREAAERGITQEQIEQGVLDAIRRFLEEVT